MVADQVGGSPWEVPETDSSLLCVCMMFADTLVITVTKQDESVTGVSQHNEQLKL